MISRLSFLFFYKKNELKSLLTEYVQVTIISNWADLKSNPRLYMTPPAPPHIYKTHLSFMTILKIFPHGCLFQPPVYYILQSNALDKALAY